MKIQYCSDLHLEFEHNQKYLQIHKLKVSGEILVLAGDIVPLHDEYLNNSFFDFLSNNYKHVYWVPGNHEFYHKDIADFSPSFHIRIRDNISIVNNVDVEMEDVCFIFSTLWSTIGKNNEKLIEQGVSDYDCILNNGKKIRVKDTNNLHIHSLAFIKQKLQSTGKTTVIVTHHLPSSLCNSPAHANSPVNEAFCVDLSSFIENCGAKFWIYGHSHFNQKPIYIGKTILLTNQLGYLKYYEQVGYKNNAYISI
ncbi:MAG: metallophosphoesterase [Bacteroidetes bacterium HGW-Bacteroidetes-21]|jgi:predicted phosphohydrolase|nr:MAG: metallophosphoesterase [Bacteroidetes bacterium HGW-Bacteroidetes-21]